MDPLIADLDGATYQGPETTRRSAVSWGAIVAGAVAAAALSMILLMLGVGLGLSSVSPWAGEGVSATTFGVSSIVWLTLTQLLASGMGGYLAGRLRTRWASTANDEVYFRDTAHGFLAWAVASIATAALLSSTVTGIVGGAASAGAAAASTTAKATAGGAAAAGATPANAGSMMDSRSDAGGNRYAIDALFRSAPLTPQAAASGNAAAQPTISGAGVTTGELPFSRSMMSGATSVEVSRIFEHSLAVGELSPEDVKYVGQLVAQRTGLSPAEAEKRVTDGYTRLATSLREAEAKTKEAADKARKAAAYATLWIFISLLIGAFIASVCATFGGRQRDAEPLPL
jgi:hypothetical protein